MSLGCRVVFIALLAAAIGSFATKPVPAAPFPNSIAQVGPWRLGAYTRGQETAFENCSLSRVQNEGFSLYIGLTASGIMGIATEAPAWGLTPNQNYTVSMTVGATPFTFSGRATSAQVLSIRPSPEFFTELKPDAVLTATANQRHFAMHLDGIETAMARLKDCAKQYAGRTLSAAQTAPAATVAAPAPGTAQPAPKSGLYSGTGFYINANTVITNNHVVAGCTQVGLFKNGASLGPARALAVNASDDLAAIHTDRPATAFLKLRTGVPIKPAESVLVFGYPWASALSSTGNTTLGNVTALAGFRDDPRRIQISAPVQPGNSGGPVVDSAGRLMAVVVAEMNAVAMARTTGAIPQNVNFAIKATTLANFLEAHNIAYQSDAAAITLPETERAERAEAASLLIMCRR